MKTVQRGNRQLQVADDRLEDMVKSGYVEVDGATGMPIAPPDVKPDGAALKKENAALKKENRALKEKLAELMEQKDGRALEPGA